jgi:hypothetical protein
MTSQIRHLELADQHIVDGMEALAHQLKTIADLEANGLDTRLALDRLHELEELQAKHFADRERLRQEFRKQAKLSASQMRHSHPIEKSAGAPR